MGGLGLGWGRGSRVSQILRESSHDHRFEAENACGGPNLFHVTMTWQRLDLTPYKADLCQLVDITF